MIDESSEFGERAARHLHEEAIVWLPTVTPSGAPLPCPACEMKPGRNQSTRLPCSSRIAGR
jgi:hypothetical protein